MKIVLSKSMNSHVEKELAVAEKELGSLGVRVVRATDPAPPADSLRLDLIRAWARF
jgi:hypothetical protein